MRAETTPEMLLIRRSGDLLGKEAVLRHDGSERRGGLVASAVVSMNAWSSVQEEDYD